MARKGRVGLLSVLLVCGCFQRISPIRTVEGHDGVAFELPGLADGLASGRDHQLLELMVTKRGCSSPSPDSSTSEECTMWSIERATAGPSGAHLTGRRIAYGKPVAGTVVRTPARDLVPARYAVSATVQQYGARGELVRSISMEGDFAIYRDGSGKQRVAGRDAPAKTGAEE